MVPDQVFASYLMECDETEGYLGVIEIRGWNQLPMAKSSAFAETESQGGSKCHWLNKINYPTESTTERAILVIFGYTD